MSASVYERPSALLPLATYELYGWSLGWTADAAWSRGPSRQIMSRERVDLLTDF